MAEDVLLLCGGLGTRLGEAAGGRPKPMVLAGDKPFLELLVDWAAGQGFSRFIFCSGHKAHMIRDHFRSSPGREYLHSVEKEPLGTGGALKLAAPLRRSRAAVVLNGDSFCDVDLGVLVKEARRGVAAMALVKPSGRLDGGFAAVAGDGRITGFAEKDPKGGPWINAGALALGQAVCDAIADGFCSLEREVLPRLLDRGVYGLRTNAPLYDIGTPERLAAFRRLKLYNLRHFHG
jgi:NDP-sugar pyrophosphorylase family protein